MVYVKATDGKEIRKFRIDPDLTFDALKKQIVKLFPNLADGVEFNVQYRDADGDVVSISTDEEVQTALSHLPADETWLIQAARVQKPRVRPRASNRDDASGGRTALARREIVPFGGSLLGRILDDVNPFWTPETSLMDWPSSAAFGRWDDDIEEEWRHRTEQLRKMHNDHMKVYEEQMKKAEADIKKALKEQRSGKGGEVTKSGEPKWHVQTFGSWEPQMTESPHGSRTVIGPVGYHMYWGYSDPTEEPKPQGEQPAQQQGEQKREETSSATPQQGEHKEAEPQEHVEHKKSPRQERKKEDTKSSTQNHRHHKKVATMVS